LIIVELIRKFLKGRQVEAIVVTDILVLFVFQLAYFGLQVSALEVASEHDVSVLGHSELVYDFVVDVLILDDQVAQAVLHLRDGTSSD
jgi:hypothetical protein